MNQLAPLILAVSFCLIMRSSTVAHEKYGSIEPDHYVASSVTLANCTMMHFNDPGLLVVSLIFLLLSLGRLLFFRRLSSLFLGLLLLNLLFAHKSLL
jgi:hypothetical protein